MRSQMAQTDLTIGAVFHLLMVEQIKVLTQEQKGKPALIMCVSQRKDMRVIRKVNKVLSHRTELLSERLGFQLLSPLIKVSDLLPIQDRIRLQKRVLQQAKVMQAHITPEIVQGERHLLLNPFNHSQIRDKLRMLSRVEQK